MLIYLESIYVIATRCTARRVASGPLLITVPLTQTRRHASARITKDAGGRTGRVRNLHRAEVNAGTSVGPAMTKTARKSKVNISNAILVLVKVLMEDTLLGLAAKTTRL